ncbi:hypothetical protein [Rhodospira trueperi]|uniref:Uncharacterized protein n=1 Tax=Rhodospira trueperi TaxID=69960 RepID=A0A1G7EKB6_9PROT|nr:hypothetical protein [Rhodospira trueperi]SDE64027.1 hypothetical protein SAMN05421720_109107 [Rhodospira trueperi]
MRRAAQSVRVSVRHMDGVPQSVKDEAARLGGEACGLCADTWLFRSREDAVRFAIFAGEADCSITY